MTFVGMQILLSYSWHVTLQWQSLSAYNKNNGSKFVLAFIDSIAVNNTNIFTTVCNPGYTPSVYSHAHRHIQYSSYVKQRTVYFCKQITWVNWQCLADILSDTGYSSGHWECWGNNRERPCCIMVPYKPIFRSTRVLPGSLSFRTHNTTLTTAVSITPHAHCEKG